MNVVFLHGSSLNLERAHWVQILSTAYALARTTHHRVTVVPRTMDEDAEAAALGQMAFERRSNFRIRPLVSRRTYRRFRLSGDLLSTRQGMLASAIAQRAARRLFGDLQSAANEPFLVITREQDFPITCARLIEKYGITTLNELHKFESVKNLEAKLKKKRPGRRTLSQFKTYARAERAAEFARLARFDGVVCTTRSIRDILAAGGFPRPMLVQPNGADLDFEAVPLAPDSAGRDIDILYVGQLYRWKGVDLLVEAMKHLPSRRLTIVGGNREEDFTRLRGAAERFGVAGRIDFLGHRAHSEVISFYRRSRVGAVPLPRAGFPEARLFCCPLKALEMMAAGTPFVATRLRSVEGLLQHGVNAWLVDPDDALAFAEGLRRVLDDHGLAHRLIDGGRRTAEELSYENRARNIVDFAQSLR